MPSSCHGCRQPYPPELLQEHHVDMASQSSETVMICPGCHHNLHRIAEKLAKGQDQAARLLAEGAYTRSVSTQKRILGLAARVARSMVAIREGDAKLPETVKLTIELELPREAITRLKLQALEWNGGRPGLRPYVRHILLGLARKGRKHEDVDTKQKEGDGTLMNLS